MKDRHISKDWVIDDYTIIIEDDTNMNSESSSLNFYQYAKSDMGGPLFRRLLRQMFLGTVYLVSNSQNAERIVKEERELIPCKIKILKHCYVCCDFWRTQRIIERFLIRPLEILERVYIKLKVEKKHFEKALLKPNKIKKMIYRLTIYQYKLYSHGYVVYPSLIDYGSDLVENEVFDFVVPVQYAFGALNSENFRFFQHYLSAESDKSIDDVPVNDSSTESHVRIFETIITKKEVKKEETSSGVPF